MPSRENDEDAASAALDRAQAAEKDLGRHSTTAAAEGLEVVRHSPFRRRELSLEPQWPICTAA